MNGDFTLTAGGSIPPAIGESPPRDLCPAAARRQLWTLVQDVDWAALEWPDLVQELMSRGRTDIPMARLAEGHIDAMRILQEAGREPVPGCLYGVWASRSRGGGLCSERTMDGLLLSGTVPFASGAGLIDRALVTATVEPGTPGRGASQVLVDADVSTWAFDPGSWQPDAMGPSRSFRVTVSQFPVPGYRQIGPDDFYLNRPGFLPGGIGVAAVWVGAAARIVDLGSDSADPSPDQAGRIRRGRAMSELATAAMLVRYAARLLGERDPAAADGQGRRLVTEVRAGVGAALRRMLTAARDLAGPAGLAYRPLLAQAIDDLELYVRQQHADRDAEELGAGAR